MVRPPVSRRSKRTRSALKRKSTRSSKKNVRKRSISQSDVSSVRRRLFNVKRRYKKYTKKTSTDIVTVPYEKGSVRIGRKPRMNIRQLRKETLQDGHWTVFRYQAVSSPDDNRGFMLLNYRINSSASIDANTDTRYMVYPCHAFDLTSCQNTSGVVTSNYAPGLGMGRVNIYDNNVNNLGFFNILPTQSNGGVTQNDGLWRVESISAPNISGGCVPGAKSILEWVDIRLILYGRAANYTKYVVELVQFDMDHCSDAVRTLRTSSQGRNQEEFNEYLVKPYISNPILTNNTALRKYMKVLYHKEINIQPKDADYSNVQPNAKEIRIFKWMNRLCRYNWDIIDGTNNLPLEDMTWRQTQGTYRNTVHPKARIFLMIRAQSTLQSSDILAAGYTPHIATNTEANLYPTYDILIRTKHNIGSQNVPL